MRALKNIFMLALAGIILLEGNSLFAIARVRVRGKRPTAAAPAAAPAAPATAELENQLKEKDAQLKEKDAALATLFALIDGHVQQVGADITSAVTPELEEAQKTIQSLTGGTQTGEEVGKQEAEQESEETAGSPEARNIVPSDLSKLAALIKAIEAKEQQKQTALNTLLSDDENILRSIKRHIIRDKQAAQYKQCKSLLKEIKEIKVTRNKLLRGGRV